MDLEKWTHKKENCTIEATFHLYATAGYYRRKSSGLLMVVFMLNFWMAHPKKYGHPIMLFLQVNIMNKDGNMLGDIIV